MRRYEILEHTADLRLKTEGDSLEELFLAALEGMNNVIKKDICSDVPKLVVEIKLAAIDETALLIDFLSEVLTKSHERKAVFCKVEFQSLKASEFKAKIFGVPVDQFDEDIKAVTYHEANIIKNAQENYETMIVFDI